MIFWKGQEYLTKMIAIIDYDAGNLKSVAKALEFLSAPCIVTRDRDEILNADKVILPGVGNFGDCMEKLENYGLVSIIKEVVAKGTPFLGICLGFQLLFESSDEAPGVKGLSLLPGKILRIPEGNGLKIPQIGWNSLELCNDGALFKGIKDESYVYFVHSYYLESDADFVKAKTPYGINLSVSVEKDNIFGTQFHPEKSGNVGLSILKNFLEL